MATEKEITTHKSNLLDAINNQNWESADTEMAWLSQNYPELQPDDFYPDLLDALNPVMGSDCKIPIALFIRGFINSNLGNYGKAIADFDKVIEFNRNNPQVYIHRGIAKAFQGNHQEAHSDLDISIHLNPYDAGVYFNRGSTKKYLGDYEGALNDCEEAIYLDSNNLLCYYLKGFVLLKLGEEQKAEDAFNIFYEDRDKFGKKYSDKNKPKKRMKVTKEEFIRRLNILPDKLSFLKNEILDISPHEITLYLYALTDHSMRNTICYIAVVNNKCNYEVTEKHIRTLRYYIQYFKNLLHDASIDTRRYPSDESPLIQELNHAICVRNHIAHGKNVGKSLNEESESSHKWEAISGLTDTECYYACICFIDFFVEYLKFFDGHIKHRRWKEFNPFDVNSQCFIDKGDRNEEQTEGLLREMKIISSQDRRKCCPKDKK